MPWTVFYVPFSVQELYGTNGRINVKGSVDGHPFTGILLPSRNGHYLVFNRELRTQCEKHCGDTVCVEMQLDNSPRTVEIPAFIRQAVESKGLLSAFIVLPDYIKREDIKRIEDAKRDETREKRLTTLLAKLGQGDGTLSHS